MQRLLHYYFRALRDEASVMVVEDSGCRTKSDIIEQTEISYSQTYQTSTR